MKTFDLGNGYITTGSTDKNVRDMQGVICLISFCCIFESVRTGQLGYIPWWTLLLQCRSMGLDLRKATTV